MIALIFIYFRKNRRALGVRVTRRRGSTAVFKKLPAKRCKSVQNAGPFFDHSPPISRIFYPWGVDTGGGQAFTARDFKKSGGPCFALQLFSFPLQSQKFTVRGLSSLPLLERKILITQITEITVNKTGGFYQYGRTVLAAAAYGGRNGG